MAFLRNAWYVACWSDDVRPGELFSRKLLDEEIVFYRKTDSAPVALHDRCPHRFIPLHLGKLHDDVIECCYHGLQFDCSGKCVKNPHGDGKIPAAAKVRSYPVEERHGIVWIWMGDREADASTIPAYPMLDAGSGFHLTKGQVHIGANYVLMGENLLDLSHVAFLHDGLIGSKQMVATLPVVREENGVLHVDREMPDVDVPAVFDMLFRQDGKPVDAWQNMRWMAPGCYLLDAGVKAPGGEREVQGWYYGIHLLTPETSSTTHYHFASARPPGSVSDAATDAELARLRRIAFAEQDKPIVDAQQQVIGDKDLWAMKPVLLAVDAGPVRMRRTVERLVKEEADARERAVA
jgi:phenylpropionate dioxygenase-like ring-hydroxylating dioxygenase large terminal subunit